MKTARLEVLLGMIIAASSLGARGLMCGPCPESSTRTIALLPPSSDGGTGEAMDAGTACEKLCPDALHCEAGSIRAPTSGDIVKARFAVWNFYQAGA